MKPLAPRLAPPGKISGPANGKTNLPKPADAYAVGGADAKATLGLTTAGTPPSLSGVAAVPHTPAAKSYKDSSLPAAIKGAAFSMSPNPETRAQEALRDNVRQPPTNEDRRIATGIDPAFNYLSTPSESDPYSIPRMF